VVVERLQGEASASDVELTARGAEQPVPTHFLLYLNQQTYAGKASEALVNELRTARAAKLPIVMIHENDPDRHGCAFSTFFSTTPPDLIDNGL